ncbi:MAG: response regulator transcription factor [Pseudomonadota bacterium]
MKPTNEQQKTRVLIVEDDQVFANELHHLLRKSEEFEVVGWAQDVASALDAIHTPHDLAIVDVGLPDGSGVDVVQSHREKAHSARCLVMTVFEDAPTTQAILKAGAEGYVLKTDPELLKHVRSVMEGKNPIDPNVTGHLLESVRKTHRKTSSNVDLSPREVQTLQALALGLSYNKIATTLGVSSHTVPDYIKSLYRKLAVNSRSEAVYQGVRKGLIDMQAPAEDTQTI